MTRRCLVGLAGAALAFSPLPTADAHPVLVPRPAAVVAADEDCADVTSERRDDPRVTGDNEGHLALHVAQAQELARDRGRPGAGVTVVVVDSGIGIARDRVPTGHAPAELQTAHGLTAAGIVAGPDQQRPKVPVGIAPGARLVDAPFYDAPHGEGDEESRRPMAGALAAALDAVRARLGPRTVVLVPVQVEPTPQLERAVGRLVRAGALVVAPSGDRPEEDQGTPYDAYAGEPEPGEDVVDRVWPAGHPGVVSVGMSRPEARPLALRNSGVDLAAPGIGSVSIARDGGHCVVGWDSTHWSAAQVAGVAALVWSYHRGDSAEEVRRRLERTASGNGDRSSPVTGHGVVQPVEALQRRLQGMADGMEEREVVARAQPPAEREDVLAATRKDAVWWGLAGGGALVVLLVLRPVLARRRR
ncbi:S8/S53 family peptidase [Nocardioides sp. SYSU DS0651]|uniref:S8/S53 family peptidase n=1 Tax=Nocardioides sp. SYSU DS0651 TaxID=3415955 RepID=UPI003F4C60B1